MGAMPGYYRVPLNVFLDTEVYRGEAFDFSSPRLTSIAEHGRQGHIRLIITDVTVREVEAGILRHIKAGIGHLRNDKKFREKTKVLRHHPAFAMLSQRPSPGEVAEVVTANFRTFLSTAQAVVIPCTAITAGPLLEKYFALQPPFGEGVRRKQEWPDAIVLAALEEWTRANGPDALTVVSADENVGRACTETESGSARLVHSPTLDDCLVTITRILDVHNQIRRWEGIFAENSSLVLNAVEEEFAFAPMVVDDRDHENPEVTGLGDIVIKLDAPQVVGLDESGARARFFVRAYIQYTADISYDDSPWPDEEFGPSYGVQRFRATSKQNIMIPVSLSLSFDSGQVDKGDVVLEDVVVNNQKDIRVVPFNLDDVTPQADDFTEYS